MVYIRNDGLRVKEVEIAWGMDMEAIEFPLELAIAGKILFFEFLKNKNKLLGKISEVEILSMLSYCDDVIENNKTGNITYILEPFWNEQVKNMKDLIKKLNKLNK